MSFVAAATAAVPLVNKLAEVVGNFVKDPKKAQEMEAALVDVIDSSDQRQTQLNLEYAKNRSIYMAGARPGIMWATGAAWIYAHLMPALTIQFTGDVEAAMSIRETFSDGAIDTMLWFLLGGYGVRSLDKKLLRDKS